MATSFELLEQLSSQALSSSRRSLLLREFARNNGWRPSDELEYPETNDLACAHLLAEQGLENSAAITFLRGSRSFSHLNWTEQTRVLSISYNNLVDWHCFPDHNGLHVVFNRTKPFTVNYISLHDNAGAWRVEEFDKIVGRKPTPNLPALDTALVRTISYWKRLLASELKDANIATPISDLFNAVLFVRALEDDNRKQYPSRSELLLDLIEIQTANHYSIRELLNSALSKLGIVFSEIRPELWSNETLSVFDKLDTDTVREFCSQFYSNRFAPYRYDFSLISKHALSHIYEHYISSLREPPDDGPSLFSELPIEEPNRTLAGIYTPQYLARFFARYLEQNYTPPKFRQLKIVDPSCGSGVFLRTVLELQCDPMRATDPVSLAHQAFGNLLGVDIDPNACNAARLSLSLLHLVLTGQFPRSLDIRQGDAIELMANKDLNKESFDAVLANPPYVKWERLSATSREVILGYLGDQHVAKPDLFVAFVKAGLELIVPGGFLLFILPHAFLLSRSAARIRKSLAETCWIRMLADLSEIDVFENVNSYPVILIAQKKAEHLLDEPLAKIVKCMAFAGHALQAALETDSATTPYYAIYEVQQAAFAESSWRISSPSEYAIKKRLEKFSLLKEFVNISEGFITGMDSVFIRARSEVPAGESAVYRPYLSDREMDRYSVPKKTKSVVFYPYDGDVALEMDQIRERFPKTWHYLESHKTELSSRKSLYRIGQERWWRPLWPRPPKNMLRPKLVSPHLMLFPRFSYDVAGEYAVSHSPILIANDTVEEEPVLLYCLAVLNSPIGHWQIASTSHKYQRGYTMVEPVTLREFRIPAPGAVPPKLMRTIQETVRKLMRNPENERAETSLAECVSKLYGVGLDEFKEIYASL